MHPYHKEYLEVMKHPIFNNPKVFKWTGDHLSNRGDLPARANYRTLKELMLEDNMGEKLVKAIKEKGFNSVILYAITDIATALMKVFQGQDIEIPYIYDRNSELTEWNGLPVKKPLHTNLEETKEPLLVTLVARHGEMEEFLRHQGYKGEILSLQTLLDDIKSCER